MRRFVVAATVMSLAACTGMDRTQSYDSRVAATVNAVGGASAGSYIGGQFGSGAGSIFMALFGAVVGGAAGWSYGSTLMPSDRTAFLVSARQAMDSAGDGEVVSWANPETRVAGTVKPVRSYVAANGVRCRDFEASVAAREGVGQGKGTACRGIDGAWQIEPRALGAV